MPSSAPGRRAAAGLDGASDAGFQARVVDAEDLQVQDGTPGELVVRADEPYAFASGYWRMPEATVRAGETCGFTRGPRRRGADGWVRFLDRMKDVIDVEARTCLPGRSSRSCSSTGIESVAVIPVPSELGEDDVMACVVCSGPRSTRTSSCSSASRRPLPYFAIPRYVDYLDELPLTENGKIQKFVLRERGVSETTWDREEDGVPRPR